MNASNFKSVLLILTIIDPVTSSKLRIFSKILVAKFHHAHKICEGSIGDPATKT